MRRRCDPRCCDDRALAGLRPAVRLLTRTPELCTSHDRSRPSLGVSDGLGSLTCERCRSSDRRWASAWIRVRVSGFARDLMSDHLWRFMSVFPVPVPARARHRACAAIGTRSSYRRSLPVADPGHARGRRHSPHAIGTGRGTAGRAAGRIEMPGAVEAEAGAGE
jgi:hypothetical protein